MRISIVLLTYDTPDLIRQCLDFVRKNAGMPYELIVVANGSNPDAFDYLRAQEDLQLILNQEDQGIARGYNQGLESAGSEYVLLMSQYSLLTEGCLNSMLDCLRSEEKAAVVGPVSNEVSGYQRIPVTYRDIKEMEDFAKINRSRNTGGRKLAFRILSHCMLVKKEAMAAIGGFDERFGLGTYEDDDLCLRLVNSGYSLYIAFDAFVHYINPLSLPGADRDAFYHQLRENKQKAIDKWGFDIADYLLQVRVPITISLCLIVRNEEEVLARCLDCVQDIVDEIIVADTGSTDSTKEIACRYTDKVYDFPWIDDFAAARNFAFDHATKEYILWLDADDVISEEDRKKLLALKKTLDPAIDSVTMKYLLAFDQYGNVTTSLRRNRLVKRSNHFRWIGAVHEYLAVYGKIVDSDIAVTHKSEWHDSDRNIKIYENRLAAGESFSPRDQYYYANELLDHNRLDEAIEWYKRFLEGGQGWLEDNLSACKKLADIFKQLEDSANAARYILQSFLYDTPRAEFCCRLGYHFQLAQRFDLAAFWYKVASELEKPVDNRGFIENSCWTWVPHLQLCVCYDHLGKYELAYRHNEMAAAFIPDDPSVIHNREYLKQRLGLE